MVSLPPTQQQQLLQQATIQQQPRRPQLQASSALAAALSVGEGGSGPAPLVAPIPHHLHSPHPHSHPQHPHPFDLFQHFAALTQQLQLQRQQQQQQLAIPSAQPSPTTTANAANMAALQALLARNVMLQHQQQQQQQQQLRQPVGMQAVSAAMSRQLMAHEQPASGRVGVREIDRQMERRISITPEEQEHIDPASTMPVQIDTPTTTIPHHPEDSRAHCDEGGVGGDSEASAAAAAGRPLAKRRSRLGGTSAKTAEVWRFFSQLPHPEQAATCQICKKTIKATNSSTTGMIRHLRSCHAPEYHQLQEARNNNLIMKTLKNVPDEAMREHILRHISMTAAAKATASMNNVSSTASSNDSGYSHSLTSTPNMADTSAGSAISPTKSSVTASHQPHQRQQHPLQKSYSVEALMGRSSPPPPMAVQVQPSSEQISPNTAPMQHLPNTGESGANTAAGLRHCAFAPVASISPSLIANAYPEGTPQRAYLEQVLETLRRAQQASLLLPRQQLEQQLGESKRRSKPYGTQQQEGELLHQHQQSGGGGRMRLAAEVKTAADSATEALEGGQVVVDGGGGHGFMGSVQHPPHHQQHQMRRVKREKRVEVDSEARTKYMGGSLPAPVPRMREEGAFSLLTDSAQHQQVAVPKKRRKVKPRPGPLPQRTKCVMGSESGGSSFEPLKGRGGSSGEEELNSGSNHPRQQWAAIRRQRDNVAISEMIALWLIYDELPVSTISKRGFAYLQSVLPPNYLTPSEAEFHNEIIPRVRERICWEERFKENNPSIAAALNSGPAGVLEPTGADQEKKRKISPSAFSGVSPANTNESGFHSEESYYTTSSTPPLPTPSFTYVGAAAADAHAVDTTPSQKAENDATAAAVGTAGLPPVATSGKGHSATSSPAASSNNTSTNSFEALVAQSIRSAQNISQSFSHSIELTNSSTSSSSPSSAHLFFSPTVLASSASPPPAALQMTSLPLTPHPQEALREEADASIGGVESRRVAEHSDTSSSSRSSSSPLSPSTTPSQLGCSTQLEPTTMLLGDHPISEQTPTNESQLLGGGKIDVGSELASGEGSLVEELASSEVDGKADIANRDEEMEELG